MTKKKPVMLVIMDGFGCSNITKDNAVAQADLKVLPKLWKEYPHSYLGASGEDVGLPDGQIGNSEVGHLNIGAGRIVYQALTKITKDIKDGAFFQKPALVGAMENVKEKDSALHLLGLVSPGGVHSSEQHLYGLLEMAKRYGLKKSISTPSSTAATYCLAVLVNTSKNWKTSAQNSASAKSLLLAAATMPWTATNVGNASKKPMTP